MTIRTLSLAPRRGIVPAACLLAIAIAIAAASNAHAAEDRAQSRPHGERVSVDPGLVEVGDGDTVTIRWPDGDVERVRILGIDTPEVAHPQWGQPHDQLLGPEAAAFGAGAFAAAERIELLRAAETDPYGRTLGYVFLNGKNYSVLLIRGGFAVETVNHYGDNGLPDEAAAVLAAAAVAPPVPFDEPYRYRRRLRDIRAWHEAREAGRAAPADSAGP
ncbi:thermonuclease family protein [bacterium]|nr:thermonuclease family protein [bacterium]